MYKLVPDVKRVRLPTISCDVMQGTESVCSKRYKSCQEARWNPNLNEGLEGTDYESRRGSHCYLNDCVSTYNFTPTCVALFIKL